MGYRYQDGPKAKDKPLCGEDRTACRLLADGLDDFPRALIAKAAICGAMFTDDPTFTMAEPENEPPAPSCNGTQSSGAIHFCKLAGMMEPSAVEWVMSAKSVTPTLCLIPLAEKIAPAET